MAICPAECPFFFAFSYCALAASFSLTSAGYTTPPISLKYSQCIDTKYVGNLGKNEIQKKRRQYVARSISLLPAYFEISLCLLGARTTAILGCPLEVFKRAAIEQNAHLRLISSQPNTKPHYHPSTDIIAVSYRYQHLSGT